MRTLMFILGIAGAAWAQERNDQDRYSPDKFQKPKPKGDDPEVAVQGGLEISYDDNILDLNNKQIRQLESGLRPEKFRIGDAEDFVYTPWVEVEFKTHFVRQPTQFGLKIQSHTYQESSIANYEEYKIFAKQNLGKHEAGIEYSLDWDCYLRELETLPDTWESARFSEHEVEVFYRHRIADWMTLRGAAGGALRDFDEPFQYRDQRGFYVELRPAFEPVPGWKGYVAWRFKSMEAAADSTQEDTSYDQNELEIGIAAEFLDKRLTVQLRHRFGFRDYTTRNSAAVDPSHRDRSDDRGRTILELRFRITKEWTVEAGYVRWTVDSNRPHDTGDTDEEVGSRRQAFTIGASYKF
jgi:hypothetical protein